jgi:hypothetical protein
MKRYAWTFGTVGLLLASCMTLQAAQMQRRSPMMGTPNYNTATEATFKGTVEAVSQIAGMQGQRMAGTHLTVKTEKETIDVHVGPSWFLEQHKMAFAKGDQIEVTGSRVKFGNEDAVLAREIKKNGQTFTLRNAQGIPVWSGMGMGRRRPS